jgi:hypothetical protein
MNVLQHSRRRLCYTIRTLQYACQYVLWDCFRK